MSRKRVDPGRVLPWLFFLWMAFVLERYFSIPADPFTLLRSAFTWAGTGGFESWGFFLRVGRILGVVLAVVGGTLSIGSFFLERMGPRVEEPWLRLPVLFSIGLSGLSLLWLGLGLVRLWVSPLMLGVLVLLLLVSLPGWRRIPAGSRVLWPRDAWSWSLLGVAGLYLLFSVPHLLLPETHSDGLVYHLGTLSFWLFHHGITDLPSQPMGGFPYGGELYFLTGYWPGGTEAVKGLNLAALIFLALGVGGWAGEKAGVPARWLALGMVLTLPLLHLVAWTSQIEVLQTLFLILFLYGMERLARGERPWAALTALWAAMALAIKYTSIFGIVAGLAAFAFGGGFRQGGKVRRDWGVAAVILMVVAGPWLLRNWVHTGDPVYPYLADWFGGRHMSPQGSAFMLQDQGASSTLWGWDLPWRLWMSRPALFNFSGPLPMVLLPLGLLLALRKGRPSFLLVSVLVLWPLGLAVTGTLKFHLPALVLSYVLLAALSGRKGEGRWSRVVAAAALLSGVLTFPYLAGLSGVYYSGGGIWSGRETPQAYRARVVRNPYEDLCDFAGKVLPVDARILVVGDARGLYYPRDFYADTGYDLSYLARLAQRGLDAEGIRKEMRKMGFTHFAVNSRQGITATSFFPAYPLDARQWAALDDYFRRGLDLLYTDGFGMVFQVRNELRQEKDLRRVDPVLFFSEPVVHAIDSIQRGDREGAQRYEAELQQLYPFPGEWESNRKFLEDQGIR